MTDPDVQDHPVSSDSLLKLDNVVKAFTSRRGDVVRAVDRVTLEIREGESLGLVGESGSGKSTTGRLALRLLSPTSGTIYFRGQNAAGFRGADLLAFRRQAQIIFQDPFSSLNPRMRVRQILTEPLVIHGLARGREREEVMGLLDMVGLRPEYADRYPFQFSGGQRQRISIARALALRPRLMIADEPVSSLDVSVQAQIINLMRDLQAQHRMAMLFISHNLAVVRHLCQRTAVMRGGQIVEEGPTEELFRNPQHEYTRLLLDSILTPEPARYRDARTEDGGRRTEDGG
ncbi:MAG TPA: ATP-binding cassette domain-containing protein [Armatimonadota bacterium]|nr:ATP-binding cassette domain-containing protein [Armatimonadota bacterium]